jgi:hypothetical protein
MILRRTRLERLAVVQHNRNLRRVIRAAVAIRVVNLAVTVGIRLLRITSQTVSFFVPGLSSPVL